MTATHTDQTIATVVRARLAAAQEAASALAPDSSWLKLCQRVNIAEALGGLTRERRTGAALEASLELERRRPLEQGNSIRIPWQTLAYATTRADVAGSSTAGGYLVPTLNTGSAAGSLLSMLVLVRLGCTAIDSSANVALPKVTANAVTSWLSTETTQAAESDLSFGQVNFSPHLVGGYTEVSRQLTLQAAPNAITLIANELMRRTRVTIEQAVFAGTGVARQPHGLVGMTSVNAVSGTSFSLATAVTCQTNAGDGEGDPVNADQPEVSAIHKKPPAVCGLAVLTPRGSGADRSGSTRRAVSPTAPRPGRGLGVRIWCSARPDRPSEPTERHPDLLQLHGARAPPRERRGCSRRPHPRYRRSRHQH